MNEKQRTEGALLEAIEYTGSMCRMVMNEEEEKKKQIIAESFSEAFYFSMGLSETTEVEEFWRLYVPMLVFLEEDGVSFYYVQTQQFEKEKVLFHEWTKKIPFSFPEGCVEAVKKSIIADVLEKKASEIITNHNMIALQYGISYRYSLPLFFQDISKPLEFPMLFVVFQGWPLSSGNDCFYEACLDAGVFLRRKEKNNVQYPKVLRLP